MIVTLHEGRSTRDVDVPEPLEDELVLSTFTHERWCGGNPVGYWTDRIYYRRNDDSYSFVRWEHRYEGSRGANGRTDREHLRATHYHSFRRLAA